MISIIVTVIIIIIIIIIITIISKKWPNVPDQISQNNRLLL